MVELAAKEREDARANRTEYLAALKTLLVDMADEGEIKASTSWRKAQELLEDERRWRVLDRASRLDAWEDMMKTMEAKEDERRGRERRIYARQHRRRRDAFVAFLAEKAPAPHPPSLAPRRPSPALDGVSPVLSPASHPTLPRQRSFLPFLERAGELGLRARWYEFRRAIRKEGPYLDMLGQPGSTPHELWDEYMDGAFLRLPRAADGAFLRLPRAAEALVAAAAEVNFQPGPYSGPEELAAAIANFNAVEPYRENRAALKLALELFAKERARKEEGEGGAAARREKLERAFWELLRRPKFLPVAERVKPSSKRESAGPCSPRFLLPPPPSHPSGGSELRLCAFGLGIGEDSVYSDYKEALSKHSGFRGLARPLVDGGGGRPAGPHRGAAGQDLDVPGGEEEREFLFSKFVRALRAGEVRLLTEEEEKERKAKDKEKKEKKEKKDKEKEKGGDKDKEKKDDKDKASSLAPVARPARPDPFPPGASAPPDLRHRLAGRLRRPADTGAQDKDKEKEKDRSKDKDDKEKRKDKDEKKDKEKERSKEKEKEKDKDRKRRKDEGEEGEADDGKRRRKGSE
eukprot:tig00000459_g1090.t1